MEHEFLETAIALAHEAGAIMKHEGLFPGVSFKKDKTFITEFDIKINQLIINTLSDRYPSHSILTEEAEPIIKNSPYTWVCDPIDGTVAFANGLPTSAFSLALTKHGHSILGVTYNPFIGNLITAETGKGANSNDHSIKVSKHSQLKDTVVGIPIWGNTKSSDVAIINQLKHKNAYPFSTCGIIYMGMLVATGSLSGAVYLGKQAHDVAALKVIVDEAGGRVTDISGNNQRYDQEVNGCVISNGKVHDELCTLVMEVFNPIGGN